MAAAWALVFFMFSVGVATCISVAMHGLPAVCK